MRQQKFPGHHSPVNGTNTLIYNF